MTTNFSKLFLITIGIGMGAILGMWVAAQIFPLSTQTTIYMRSYND